MRLRIFNKTVCTIVPFILNLINTPVESHISSPHIFVKILICAGLNLALQILCRVSGSSKLPFKPIPAAAAAPAVAINTPALNPTSPTFTPAPPVSPALTPLAPAAAALPAEWGERLLSSTPGSVIPSAVSSGGARRRRRGRNATPNCGAESGNTQTGIVVIETLYLEELQVYALCTRPILMPTLQHTNFMYLILDT